MQASGTSPGVTEQVWSLPHCLGVLAGAGKVLRWHGWLAAGTRASVMPSGFVLDPHLLKVIQVAHGLQELHP